MAVVKTLDLNFQGREGLIASYLIPHDHGVVLIESGPGSTASALERQLRVHGYSPDDVTDLLVTHIHLDHAGAAGWLAGHGAVVHVHFRGLPHLENPERLLASAARIYGDQMDALWGEMLPVPAAQLRPLHDGEVVRVGERTIKAYDTPGHATHHMCYLFEDICFSGDVGGIRLPGPRYILLPMPPPEFHLELWQESCARLQQLGMRRIAPTHFGIYEDPEAHLSLLEETLEETGAWIERTLPGADEATVARELVPWLEARARKLGLSQEEHARYEIANPSETSATGIHRYWRKFRDSQQAAE